MVSRSLSKFEMEKAAVEQLMHRLGQAVDRYEDPNQARGATGESGADVVVIINVRRIGVQVTDLDTGNVPGQARAAESKLARDAESRGTTYATWGQNDPRKMLEVIVRSISRKAKMSFAGFDEFWLLVRCCVSTFGAVASTFTMTEWIAVGDLDNATLSILANSKYTRTFIHAVLGVEEKALYQWNRDGSWSKSTLSLPPEQQGPNFWDFIAEWKRNPSRKFAP
jgi:hypothetical protein